MVLNFQDIETTGVQLKIIKIPIKIKFLFFADAARFMKTEHQGNYNKLRDHVRHTIKQSSYSQVDLSRLFQGMFTLK